MWPVFLSVEMALHIHQRVIEEFGGDRELRDCALLESAVAMPRATFGGRDLHASTAEKGAAYLFHLCANHPFTDGDKRVAVVAAELFLLLNGAQLIADDDEVEEMAMGVAAGQWSKEQVIEFFMQHVRDEAGEANS